MRGVFSVYGVEVRRLGSKIWEGGSELELRLVWWRELWGYLVVVGEII